MRRRINQTKRERLEDREAAIISAASSVFMESGAEGARMTEIAQRADVAEGTLYLYFKNKNALMQAVVADHWKALTLGARRAAAKQDGAFDQFHALADYHLKAMMAEWPLIELGIFVNLAENGRTRTGDFEFKRIYVAVFDEIFQRGKDRGEIKRDAEPWIARDMFYGTLEYSVRTLFIHGKRRSGAAVVGNLIEALEAQLRPLERSITGTKTSALRKISSQLSDLISDLEQEKLKDLSKTR